MLVVVFDVVADEALELAAVPDDAAVEKLAPDRADPALGECVGDRRPDGCLEGLEALGPEDLVKPGNEPTPTIANQAPSSDEMVAVAEEQVAGRLGGPSAGGVGGEAGQKTSRVWTLMNNTT